MTAVVDSVLPIFALIGLGFFLKRIGLIDEAFVQTSDRLVYYIFFPALLFWKIGKPAAASGIDWSFIAAVLLSVFAVFVLSLVYVRITGMPDFDVGSFSQGCYRFSSYVGMAVAIAELGGEGARLFGVLIGFVIPCINVMAVSSMIWYSGGEASLGSRSALFLKSTLTNPLIIACVAGIFYSRIGPPFPVFVDSSFALMSLMSLPLALISIGGALSFGKLGRHVGPSVAAAALKLIVLPVIGFFLLAAFHVTGIEFKVAMLYFALPTSPNNYILSALLNSNLELAAAVVVLSTILSIGALSAVIVIFG